MKNAESLPISLNSESISTWLIQHTEKDAIAAATQLYGLLKKLYRIRIGNDDLLAALDQLMPSILRVVDNLNTSIFAGLSPDGTIPQKSRKIARLGSQLIRLQCLAYCHTAVNQPLTEQRKAEAIYSALQLSGLSMRANASISERFSSTIGQKAGELYRLAHQEKLNKTAIAATIPTFATLTTIDSVLKRNLLFTLFAPFPASADRIGWYYELADHCADSITFEPSADSVYNYYWDGSEQPPQREKPIDDAETLLTLNIEAVASHLAEINREPAPIEDDYFATLRRKLNGYQDVLDSVILSKPKVHYSVTGILAITERLKQLERIFKIYRLSGQSESSLMLKSLELVPLEHELKGLPPQEHAAQQNVKRAKVEWINLQTAKIPNFFLAHAPHDHLISGQLILLYSEQEKPRLGVIRESIKSSSPLQRVLIETLEGMPKTVQIGEPSDPIEAVLLKKSGPEEIVLPPGKYSTGETLTCLERPDTPWYLAKLLEAGEHFMHYRLGTD